MCSMQGPELSPRTGPRPLEPGISRHGNNPSRRIKESAIHDACLNTDLGSLKLLAESEGGFLADDLRRKAWPILLGLPAETKSKDVSSSLADVEIEQPPWQELSHHPDEDQVQLDVNRAFIYYPNGLTEADLRKRKSELSDLITEVLRRHPFLCYFQGYHDICQVFLLVLDPPLRAPLVARLSLLRIRDFMLPTLAPTVAQLRLIPDILNAADPSLREHLAGTEPFYALSGTLTMYAHNIEGYRDIARLFDVLLVREPVFSIYLFAQIVLSRREELFDTPADDPSMLHLILSKVPRKLDLESLIAHTIVLFEKHPPETLRSWRHISTSSCLKTARNLETCALESTTGGQAYFQVQLRELRRAERWNELVKQAWMYRRPAKAVGFAILVGLAAVYLRKHPAPAHFLCMTFWRLTGRPGR
ncbi:hypothetical protein jhhlp_003471 [Lomentospora prolificans]|uniref:Rab-GAP TBC domain-containing protein n=1 Tax=Lomentospora prolificans TaxID=41688 RepID=A0A2N3N8V1_9PEZI|nr:hypothetical protein jhhlp_003471 [Lomentospora prolificans]